jgi:Mn2+/Fe2+ NRAMP family transporter
MLGAVLVAALVSSLAGAWGLSEISGWKHTLNQRPDRRSAGFYLTYALAHVAGAALVLASADLVSLAIGVEVMNALLLPVVLGFLLVLEATALPRGQRMHGWYRCAACDGPAPASAERPGGAPWNQRRNTMRRIW